MKTTKTKHKNRKFTRSGIFLLSMLLIAAMVIPQTVAAADEVELSTLAGFNPKVVGGNASNEYATADYLDTENLHPNSPKLSETAVVGYAGLKWLVVGYNGDGIASSPNQATLLLADDNPAANDTSAAVKKPEISYFDENGNRTSYSNIYGNDSTGVASSLKKAMDAYYTSTIAPSTKEASHIVPRNLTGGSGLYNYSGSSITNSSTLSSVLGSATANEYTGSGYSIGSATTFNWYKYNTYRLANGTTYTGYNPGTGAVKYHPDNTAGAAVSGAALWPLSIAEASLLYDEGTAYPNAESVRKYSAGGTSYSSGDNYLEHWWLRSPGYYDSNAAYVYSSGQLIAIGYYANDRRFAVRPAFNLNLQSAIFTSAAAGGKSAAAGSALSAAKPPENSPLKFTIKDTDTSFLNLTVPTGTKLEGERGTDVSFNYDAATAKIAGADAPTHQIGKYVSCYITTKDASNEILYYGKLVGTANDNGGIATFTIPSTLADGEYTVHAFNEQINDDYYSDFASEPKAIPLTVGKKSTNPDHPVIKHSHDKKYGGKDGLKAYGETVTIEIKGEFKEVKEFVFNKKTEYTLSAYVNDTTSRIIKDETGAEIGTVTNGSAVITLPAKFTDRLENGTHEIELWFEDSSIKDEAGLATIVVNRKPLSGTTDEEGDSLISPLNPQTGDDTNLTMPLAVMTGSALALVGLWLLAARRRKPE